MGSGSEKQSIEAIKVTKTLPSKSSAKKPAKKKAGKAQR